MHCKLFLNDCEVYLINPMLEHIEHSKLDRLGILFAESLQILNNMIVCDFLIFGNMIICDFLPTISPFAKSDQCDCVILVK